MPDSVPTGVITLVFTDIQGSTALWERLGEWFYSVLDRHNELIRESMRRWNGYEVKTQGDSFMMAFRNATDAVACALDIERVFATEPWPAEVGEVLVRIGMHTGAPFLGYDPGGRPDYFGSPVNRAARVESAAHGGQILISASTRSAVEGKLDQNVQLADLGSHRLRGLETPERLCEVRAPYLPERTFPAPRTLDVVRTNLPAHPTVFIGRSRELHILRELLFKPEVRLITITGPGGVGKTRLAHDLAGQCVDRYPDGVWVVALADVSGPERVAPEIASALKFPLDARRDPGEQLQSFLSERSLLLVLDNFERVLGASMLLAGILRAAPGVQCLISSRSALRLRGEHLYEVGPMRLPPRSVSSPESLLRFDSVSLFLDRACEVRPDLQLTAQNAPAIAEVCRKLDGLPLALELAAAQTAEMSVVEVLESLRSRAELHSSDSPDLPERHRTLDAAMDWSYGLLNEPEQHAFKEFSIFAGGTTREAVQAVLGPGALAAFRALRRQSLITSVEAPDGRTRYSALQLVRQYAYTRLQESPEVLQSVAESHAMYYLDLARQRLALMRSRGEARALDDLTEELDNLRASLEWAQGAGRHDLSAQLSLALYEPLWRRGYWNEAQDRLRTGLLEAAQVSTDTRALQASLHYGLAAVTHDMGDIPGARVPALASLDLRKEAGDSRGAADALSLLALLSIDANQNDEAASYLEEAIRLVGSEEHLVRGKIFHNQGYLATKRGDTESARLMYTEALAHRKAAGDARGEAETLQNLGVLAHERGEWKEARNLYHESLVILRDLNDHYWVAVTLNNLGELAELEGEPGLAVALLTHAAHAFHELGSSLESIPDATLERIAGKVGAEAYAGMAQAAQSRSWEDLAH